MKVYIAGKVSGLPTGEVFTKFGQAEYWLRQQGHEGVHRRNDEMRRHLPAS